MFQWFIHLKKKKISQLKPFDCVIIEGTVTSESITMPGGHVFFKLTDSSNQIDCAAYKPTGDFRKIISKLIVGDRLLVSGGISKYANTLNLEKIQIIKLAQKKKVTPPKCCNKSMTSEGQDKGFKCKKCGKRNRSVDLINIDRGLVTGVYEVPPSARRHLSKPIIRQQH